MSPVRSLLLACLVGLAAGKKNEDPRDCEGARHANGPVPLSGCASALSLLCTAVCLFFGSLSPPRVWVAALAALRSARGRLRADSGRAAPYGGRLA